ncbi:MAG: hypothetical protein LBE85_00335 [Candidatus Accumulibacter sp.]|nr:hypothetical protein [Accumulibacter sp.]
MLDISVHGGAALETVARPPALYDLDDLGHLLDRPKLLPPGCGARRNS